MAEELGPAKEGRSGVGYWASRRSRLPTPLCAERCSASEQRCPTRSTPSAVVRRESKAPGRGRSGHLARNLGRTARHEAPIGPEASIPHGRHLPRGTREPGGALLGRGGKQERPAMPVALPGRLLFVHSERLGLMPETAPFRAAREPGCPPGLARLPVSPRLPCGVVPVRPLDAADGRPTHGSSPSAVAGPERLDGGAFPG